MSVHSTRKHKANRGHLNLSTKETTVGRPAVHHRYLKKNIKKNKITTNLVQENTIVAGYMGFLSH